MQYANPSLTDRVANRVTNRVANGYRHGGHRHGQPPVRAILLLANMLDCEALSGLFRRREGVEIVEASADVDYGLSRCEQLFPDVLMVDPDVALDVIPRATEMVRLMQIRHLVVLEDRVHEGRLVSLLAIPSVSYFTRQAGFEALYSATKRMATEGTRIFEPSVARRIVPTARGLRLRPPGDRPSITALTSREVEVMGLLAGGRSVRECAEHLRLAQSTIDNHKARLMKKLEIHKVAELTQVAIREGLISI